MAKSRITLIGLNTIGASVGLALRHQPGNYEVVGHDADPDLTRRAKQIDAVDRTEWNLHRACMGASLLITSVPLGELRELLEEVHEDLAEGATIFALTEVMREAQALTVGVLPDHLHFIPGHPILTLVGGSLEPRRDLFEKSPFCVATDVETEGGAIELINNVVGRLGATPLYMDAIEHDGVISLVDHLPTLFGLTLLQTATSTPGWRDGQKLAGRRFAAGTEVGEDAATLATTLFANRENILQRLLAFDEVLDEWRQMLRNEDFDTLQARIDTLLGAREQWERQAKLRDWEDRLDVETEEQPGMLRQMFFGNLTRNRYRPDD